MSTVRVQEIFGPTIQGEGVLAGRPTLFIRLGGCDFRCSWCDTLYAVDVHYKDTWHKMEVDAVVQRCLDLGRPSRGPGKNRLWVTISGGNPILWPALPDLIKALQEVGYYVTIETQGPTEKTQNSTDKWAAWADHVCLSPKPPSSGMAENYALRPILDLIRMREPVYLNTAGVVRCSVKIVIMDEADLNWAYARYVELMESDVGRYALFFLQVGNPNPGDPSIETLLERYKWLVETVLSKGWTGPAMLPQVHTLLWGNERGR